MTTRATLPIVLFFSFLFTVISCSKINEATNLGGDIIPGVDGVNTFDTTLTVETYNNIYDALLDSNRVTSSEDHILGNISNDPLFGKTNAKIFLELKPEYYKWNFSGINNKDSLYIDSVVMVLGWTGTYGDTLSPLRFRVYEMDQSNNFKIDSFYLMREQYFTYSNLLGTKDVYPFEINDSVKVFQDTTIGQLRIKLNNSFGRRLLDYDTLTAYASDSAFKTYLKGFAIEADPGFGNALMTFGLQNNDNTKLAIYYHYTKGGKNDTTVNYFRFNYLSARHNYVNRTFSPTILTSANDPGEDDNIYLINTPGTYATVKIPALRYFNNNRIIHRAELIVEQVYDPSDLTFRQPDALMLDVYDSSISDYKFTPYDFAPDDGTGPFYLNYGMYGKNTVDNTGNPIRVWKFNVSRYVQNILTQKEPLHNFRLFTHRNSYARIKESFSTNEGGYTYFNAPINSKYVIGRVRVGGGNHTTQRMRLRIIYSKI